LFETGAVSKNSDSHVCTYLVDLQTTDVKDPLSQFQHTKADRAETKKLVAMRIGKLGDPAFDEQRLDRTFGRSWPDFEKTLGSLPPEDASGPRRIQCQRFLRW
jgi:hypothetical protein